jgi:hypothetical protein
VEPDDGRGEIVTEIDANPSDSTGNPGHRVVQSAQLLGRSGGESSIQIGNQEIDVPALGGEPLAFHDFLDRSAGLDGVG